ncbi:tetraspanin-18-like isoform X2 [Dunckerocampus dactyliophorus]|nr:tetraspanin-18-like isoform X2 [Dunckerocampus dactyliophorus]XP_054632705.1 tetraspanin-18-like isoform X2 [Dunckerocampus dactyliophorus]
MIAVSVWILLENDPIGQVLMGNSLVRATVNCAMILSVVVFLVGLLGCFAAIRQKQFLLSFFFMAVGFIFILQLLCLIVVFANRAKLQKKAFHDQLYEAYENKTPGPQPAVQLKGNEGNSEVTPKDHWKSVMVEFECCGVDGLEDLKNTTLEETDSSDPSVKEHICCTVMQVEKEKEVCKTFNKEHNVAKDFQLVGCYEKVLSDYETYPFLAAALFIVVLTVEVSAMFLAVMLYREI